MLRSIHSLNACSRLGFPEKVVEIPVSLAEFDAAMENDPSKELPESDRPVLFAGRGNPNTALFS